MGNCLGSPRERERDVHHHNQPEGEEVALGKNQRLSTTPTKWSSAERMTAEELRAKRAEFWETSPAFEGRKEIWEALRAACEAFEKQDYALAQGIADGAELSLPRGTLAEVYDKLGNRYCVPNYCLASPPGVLLNQSSATVHSGVEDRAGSAATAPTASAAEPVPLSESPAAAAGHVSLKIRMSNLTDTKLTVAKTDTVSTVLMKLGAQENFDGAKGRLVLTGKILQGSSTIESLQIPKGFYLQAHVP